MKSFTLRNVKKQAGISLPEMLIVTIIVGLLGILSYSQFGNGSDAVRAKTTFDAAQKIASSWSLMTQLTGVTGTIAGSSPYSSLVAALNTPLDAVMVGNSPSGIIATTYENAYNLSGLKPLSNMATIVTTPSVGVPGSYKINDYPVTLASALVGGMTVLNVVFTGVPDNVVSSIYSSHMSATFVTGTAVTSGLVQYTAVDASGNHTLTLQFNL